MYFYVVRLPKLYTLYHGGFNTHIEVFIFPSKTRGSPRLKSLLEKDRLLKQEMVFRGGDKRDRTAGLLNAIQALSQLSYTPIILYYFVNG